MQSSPLLAVVALVALSPLGCAIDPKPQKVFENTSHPPVTATRDWNGEEITIHNEGIEPENELGGVEVVISKVMTRISVEAVFAAHADDDKQPNAEQSMSDAMKTLAITETAGRFDVACGHGETHGTSRAMGSGCRTLRVTIPAGTSALPHALTIRTGSGAVRVGLHEGEAPLVRSLVIDNRGPSEIEVRARPVKDARLTLGGQGVVTVGLPGDFSARSVVFAVAGADPARLASGVSAPDFPGMVSGAAYPASGALPDAAAELKLESNGALAPSLLRVVKL